MASLSSAFQPPAAPSPPQMSPGPSPQGGGGAAFGNASLYVGDLDRGITEAQLYELFNPVAPVASVRVCRDQVRRFSLGYAYVNFHTMQDAKHAMEILNFTPIHGKPIRIMFSHRDPSIRKSGLANIFIKNLDPTIDNKSLHDIFASFGTVLSCKVATDINGQSKGYGFVQFDREEAAENAINQLNGMLMNERKVYVGLFVRRQERDKGNGSIKFTNVYVKNLPETFTDDDLIREFKSFGDITSAVVMRDATGNSRGFGFVNFDKPDAAAASVENLNGKTINDKVLYVGRAQKKGEREAELKAKYEQERSGRLEKLRGRNLYVKNLDENIDDVQLRNIFSEFGFVISSKVMVDSQGQSKGSGFVAFSSAEDAIHAINEMNGKMIGRKPLYVALAQSKEERRARLQAHFAQLNAQGAMTPVPSIPGYHPGPPRLAPPQHLYFGQGGPSLIPPQPAGYSFQQQLIPGMRTPNYVMPYNVQRQGQAGQRIGARRQQMQQQQQQLVQRNTNQGFRYMQSGRNGVDPTMQPQGLMGPMMPLPLDPSGMHVAQMDAIRPSPIPITALASALASASSEQQRIILGEQLYPLVERIEREQAGKVTGMLLEMDQTEVLHLIESPDDLQSKVAEAMEVLQQAHVAGSDAVNQLGSLSLND
ncbi:polyadenylate-binding protein 3 isoform X2 [Ananas comosus]|uniref:Polyadenylate-binding protein n=1 Tax=Ananas comosus TaxID=4615 RepID=A0A199UE77_ANACO|nr:polyadenylate-binding protein 3 isoform X2 [Ananas comosus]OAY63029.1 Polyadenylate-binding protein 3 [Ananas comosus]